MERTLFISERAAERAATFAALKAGVHPRAVDMHCKVKRVFRRGALQGYEAWFRTRFGVAHQPLVEV